MPPPRPFDHQDWTARIADEVGAVVRSNLSDSSDLQVLPHHSTLRGAIGWLRAATGVQDRIPDLVFAWREETVVVEVGLLGELGRDKWPEFPMVHLDVDGAVEVVSSRPSALADLVAQAIRDLWIVG